MTTALLPLVVVCLAPEPAKDSSPSARWEKAVAGIEKRLQSKPPPKDAVFFAGSSSVVRWDLEKSFPGQGLVKVAFGGSHIADSTHFAARLFHPYKPAMIVFYAGDNDIGAGKGPEKVHEDFCAFVKAVHEKSPATKVLFLSIKPSIARWKHIEKIRKANGLIEAECKKDSRLLFVDVGTVLLDRDGKPRPELFAKDGLHLSPAGYELWTPIVRKHLPGAEK